jgi:hypothetical protein
MFGFMSTAVSLDDLRSVKPCGTRSEIFEEVVGDEVLIDSGILEVWKSRGSQSRKVCDKVVEV